jgi:plasmid stabilization system protein ParE
VTLRLRISARAATEIERADAWWRDNRPSAPGALREDLKAAFQLLLRQPGVGIKVTGARVSATRRLHLGRVRYFVYYRVKNDELAVLSVWHASRASAPRV